MAGCMHRVGCGRGPIVLLMLFAGVAGSFRLTTAGPAEDFRAARNGLARQIQGRDEQACLAALEELRRFPVADAARLAVAAVERHQSRAVHDAAVETLCALAQKAEPARCLRQALAKKLAGRQPSRALLPIFLALGSSGPEAAAQLREVLAEGYRPVTPAAARLLAVIDALGERADALAVAAAATAAGSRPFDEDFAFRRAVVQALLCIRQKEALDALLELLPRLQGEVRGEAIEYLAEVTGQPVTNSEAEWRTWWQTHREQFVFPRVGGAAAALVAGPRAADSYYYNLPIYARRVVFVIDTSTSMRGDRLLAAQRELINALQSLTDHVSFTVVAFDSAPRAWQPTLVAASPPAKTAACQFVARQQASGATASFDALELAFSFDAEAIYFLTDGAPSAGKISQPDRIVEAVTQQNRLRRITINAIGIGVGPEGGSFEVFLRTLAEQNFGRFRRVDE